MSPALRVSLRLLLQKSLDIILRRSTQVHLLFHMPVQLFAQEHEHSTASGQILFVECAKIRQLFEHLGPPVHHSHKRMPHQHDVGGDATFQGIELVHICLVEAVAEEDEIDDGADSEIHVTDEVVLLNTGVDVLADVLDECGNFVENLR